MGNTQKKAMITGITGQDGGYLAKFLLSKGYRVIGLFRRGATDTFEKLKEHGIFEQIEMVGFELMEFSNICRLMKAYKPDEFYNLAAQSFVAASWEEPIYTLQADATGVANILEAIREFSPKTKFYQASTSEMFGKVQAIPQNETTPFYPRSPYGCAKLYAHWLTVNYRESFGIFACSGILFNHESPMRGKEFVTRKITDHFAKLHCGLTNKPLELGNLNAKRDWGFAGDYVEGMWMMLQQDHPDTYVLSSEETHPIRDFVTIAGKYAGFDITWEGEGSQEIGVDKNSNKVVVKVNPKFFRPAEVDILLGDSSKAHSRLNWKRKVSYEQLCEMMVKTDIERYKKLR
ncbi:MAG: GDP-mannose 4,6-dehydratase [Alphaproteobacteria bacterium]|nr:GDP-mannose 4,6-dehydratase [Alphaproteobacteria bacterium]